MARIICDRQATAARGNDPAGYQWQHPGDVVTVDDEHAPGILGIGWFSEVQPGVEDELPEDYNAARKARRQRGETRTEVLEGSQLEV